MKLVSPKLEKKAIKTICSAKQRVSGYALASLSADYFYYQPTQEAFARILKLARKTGNIPEYSEIANDPTLSESSRKVLLKNREKPSLSKIRASRVVQGLNQYRQLRGLYFDSEATMKALEDDKVDLDKVLSDKTDTITRLRTNIEREKSIFNIGHKSNVAALIKEVLYGKKDVLIPTGFGVWDDENGGVPPGGLFTIAATSGGGKSAMANQLLINMTTRGYDGILVTLEMTEKETMYRILSNLAEVPVTKLIRRTTTKREKRAIKDSFTKYSRKLKKLKTKYSIFNPAEEMTIEEILFLVKPYKYQVIIIDYISLLKGSGDTDDGWKTLGEIARAAKVFATANRCLVIMLAQLSDEGRVKYSQAIKEHSDVCWVWSYTDETRETGILDIRPIKARNLNPFPFQLGHDYSVMKIADVDDKDLKRIRSKNGDHKRKELDDLVREVNVDEDDDEE